MKKQTIFLLTILTINNLFGGTDNNGVTFEKQIENVKSWAEQRVREGKEVFMILGAATHEYKRFCDDKQNNKWIYVADELHTEADLPYLYMNFNDLHDLRLIKDALKGKVDQIWMDNGVGDFTEWTIHHITCFKDMLKIGGMFVYNDCGFRGSIWRNLEGKVISTYDYSDLDKLPTYHTLGEALEARCRINFNDGWYSFSSNVKYDGSDVSQVQIARAIAVWSELKQFCAEHNIKADSDEYFVESDKREEVLKSEGISINLPSLYTPQKSIEQVIKDGITKTNLAHQFFNRAPEYRRQIIAKVFGNAEIKKEPLPFKLDYNTEELPRLISAIKTN